MPADTQQLVRVTLLSGEEHLVLCLVVGPVHVRCVEHSSVLTERNTVDVRESIGDLVTVGAVLFVHPLLDHRALKHVSLLVPENIPDARTVLAVRGVEDLVRGHRGGETVAHHPVGAEEARQGRNAHSDGGSVVLDGLRRETRVQDRLVLDIHLAGVVVATAVRLCRVGDLDEKLEVLLDGLAI